MSPIKHHVTGLEYWRSLGQLAESPQVAEMLDKEFPGYDANSISSTSRRSFMKLMGAAMALAGVTLSGCRRWPREELAPYSSNPRGVTPGVAEHYATAWELNGVGTGLLVTSFDGRPIKIEGSPDHPSSYTAQGKYGSADAFAQASLLEMYDPDRSRYVIDRTKGQQHTTWDAFIAAAAPLFEQLKKDGGAGFAILSEATSSPSVAAQRDLLLKTYPQAKWYEYEPISYDNEREGAKLAFDKPVRTKLNLDRAWTVVSLDADLLGKHPNHTRYANDWSQNRKSADARRHKQMSRVYVAESGLSITGSAADHRLGVAPARIYALARAIAAKLGVPWITGDEQLSPAEAKFVEAAAKDLKEAGSDGVIAVGHQARPEAHALAHAINSFLKSVGNTVEYIEDIDADRPTHMQAIAGLAQAIKAKAVSTLLILGGNPVYDGPSDVGFAELLPTVPTSIHLSLYDNETSRAAKWHLPRAHYLESWGDVRSWDGTVSVQQPLILPLFGGKSAIEVLALLIGDGVSAGDKIVRRTHGQPTDDAAKDEFEKKYRKALHDGFFADSPLKPKKADVSPKPLTNLAPSEAAPSGFTLRFDVDSHTYDGRFSNNGWLQETPDPLTKLMWDNALLMGVKDAAELGLDHGDLVEVKLPEAKESIKVPVYLLPGQPAKVVSLTLGYGRTVAGPIGEGLGFNAYTIRTSSAPWTVAGAQVTSAGGSYRLVSSDEHHILSTLAREAEEVRLGEKHKSGVVIREATFDEYKKKPQDLGGVTRKVALQLFSPPTENNFRDVHAWGMTIDLTACIGCNACAVACQAENNIPVVGKDQCYRHREMNWIRIDRYFKGDVAEADPEIVFMPMTCQHCENAPCEQVCPVAATVHDSEGLNTMVYNRCIGTRYCANNCPYKVRRFNYFDYHSVSPRSGNEWAKVPFLNIPDLQQNDPKQIDPIKRMVFNPEVTVRMRGVMEKCTYCVQRIHPTVTAKRAEGADIVDGDIVTACQQACPTQAIVFGNLNDDSSQVSKLQKNARAYDVLQAELNTKPRTRYLTKLRNPADEAEAKA